MTALMFSHRMLMDTCLNVRSRLSGELTVVHGIGQCHRCMRMNERHMEDGFHSWLIKTGEGLSGI